MREFKILAIVVFFSALTYYLVEPYAHHAMHTKHDLKGEEIHLNAYNFKYNGSSEADAFAVKIGNLKYEPTVVNEKIAEYKLAMQESDANKTKIQTQIDTAKARLAAIPKDLEAVKVNKSKKEAFWAKVETIAQLKGNATAGEATYAMCMGCHMDGAVNMGGVIPPSLDHAGAIYDANYLIALIKDPAMASNVDHKYPNGTDSHPMGAIKGMVSEDQDIANVVAYLQANKAGHVTPKEAYQEACMRCHANRYGKLTQLGTKPKTKENIKTGHDIEAMKYAQNVAEEQGRIAQYMGKLPPDLSMIFRARSEHFLETFIADPQSQLAGTAMPRVGLNHEGYEKVMEYLAETGDPSKPARDIVAPWVIGFFILFTFLAYLWKSSLWRDLH